MEINWGQRAKVKRLINLQGYVAILPALKMREFGLREQYSCHYSASLQVDDSPLGDSSVTSAG